MEDNKYIGMDKNDNIVTNDDIHNRDVVQSICCRCCEAICCMCMLVFQTLNASRN